MQCSLTVFLLLIKSNIQFYSAYFNVDTFCSAVVLVYIFFFYITYIFKFYILFEVFIYCKLIKESKNTLFIKPTNAKTKHLIGIKKHTIVYSYNDNSKFIEFQKKKCTLSLLFIKKNIIVQQSYYSHGKLKMYYLSIYTC